QHPLFSQVTVELCADAFCQSLHSSEAEESFRAGLRIGWQRIEGVDGLDHGKGLGIKLVYGRALPDETATACEGDRMQSQIETVVIAKIHSSEPAMRGQFKGEGCPRHHVGKGVDAVGFKSREVGIGHTDAIVCCYSQAEFAQLWNHRGQQ